MLNTPVLFLIFNRPDTTRQVFAKIREAQPKQLFIAADGPRADRAGEAEKCALAKQIVLDNIDWDCEVKTWIRDTNVGPEISISNALSWFFEDVEYGIILEDDCLPDLSFFEFCEILLKKYAQNEQISFISGTNFCERRISKKYDYFIGHMGSTWGWASWARVFVNFKWGNIYDLKQIHAKMIQLYGKPYTECQYKIVKHSYEKEGNWDMDFFVHNLMNNKKSITPSVNLISNIGYGGTHFNNRITNILFIPTNKIIINQSIELKYCNMQDSIKKKIIKSFLEKDNPLTFRDRLYLIKVKILKLFK